MKILTWAIRLIIFLLLFLFAAANTDNVTLRLFLGQTWQAPLVIVVLVCFAAGVLFGIASLLGLIYRQRREIGRLKKSGFQPPPGPTPLPSE